MSCQSNTKNKSPRRPRLYCASYLTSLITLVLSDLQGSQTRGPLGRIQPATRWNAAHRPRATTPGSHASIPRNGMRQSDLISSIHFCSKTSFAPLTYSHRLSVVFCTLFYFIFCFQAFCNAHSSATRPQARGILWRLHLGCANSLSAGATNKNKATSAVFSPSKQYLH